jgi:hypothetical protein
MKSIAAFILVILSWQGQVFAGDGIWPTRSNPYQASSTSSASGVVTYSAANAFDGDWQTAWCEGIPGSGKGEALQIFLGDASLMGGPQKVSVQVYRGYQKSYNTYLNNSKPTKIRVDLLADDRMLASKEHVLGHTLAEVELGIVPRAKGDLWLMVTILETDPGLKSQTTCLTEVRPSFELANPHHVRQFAMRICKLVKRPKTKESNPKLRRLARKLKREFINDFESPGKPICDLSVLEVVSENDFHMWGAEMGDGANVIRLRLPHRGVEWDLLKVSGFSLYD